MLSRCTVTRIPVVSIYDAGSRAVVVVPGVIVCISVERPPTYEALYLYGRAADAFLIKCFYVI